MIVCGDVLEHIDRPGLFIKNLSNSLAPNGKLIVTLPNPWYLNYMLKNLFNYGCYRESVDHVAWYDPLTLYELFHRAKLEMTSFYGVLITKAYTLKAKMFMKSIPLAMLFGARPEVFSKTMIYEFSHAG